MRLYFRPRTPTQYAGEGVRAKNELKMEAHWPVPIVLLFDALPILTDSETKFSNGNLAKTGVLTGDTVDFLNTIPFDKVFHDSAIAPSERDEIVFHRNAEVLIPDEMPLTNLRFIMCRSQAEMETLMQMVTPEVASGFQKRVGVDKKGDFFFRRWTYVEQATLTPQQATLAIHRSWNPVEFCVRVVITGLQTRKVRTGQRENYSLHETLSFDTANIGEDYRLDLFLDDHLVYRGECRWNEPFV